MDEKGLVLMLGRLLLSWDGQWFLKVAQECGLETAVKLNARVRKSFGRIEMREFLRLLGKEKAKDLREAVEIVNQYLEIFGGKGFDMEFNLSRDDRCEVIAHRCAALEGAKRANLGRVDQSCIACPGLFESWIAKLLPDYDVRIEFQDRMGWGAEKCLMTIETEKKEPRTNSGV